MPLTTAQILAKYQRNAGNAAKDWEDGVKSVTVSPTQQAAANVDKYARGVQDAVSSGKFVNACNAVSAQDWKDACLSKGSRNYTTGISNLSPRAKKAMADQQQYAQQLGAQIQSMPNNTEADADARLMAAVNGMRRYNK